MKNVLESGSPSPYVNPHRETDVCTLYLSRLDSRRTMSMATRRVTTWSQAARCVSGLSFATLPESSRKTRCVTSEARSGERTCRGVTGSRTGGVAELVEVVTLDPTIRLDIRYATTNNFLHRPVYAQSRAFLHRTHDTGC